MGQGSAAAFIIAILAVLVLISGCSTAPAPTTTSIHATTTTAYACTADAMACPDGSYVSRTGPDCEFAPCPGAETTTTTAQAAGPITKKYFLLIFNPAFPEHGSDMVSYFHWGDSQAMAETYSADILESSHGAVNYVMAGKLEADAWPKKLSGYAFDEGKYLACWNDRSTCNSDMADYGWVLQTYDVCSKLNAGQIDELWIFGGPWLGFYEANQAGTGAFSTNGPVVAGTTCGRILNIMGFSYERGIAEMLEDFGHRTEGTMTHVYGGWNSRSGTTAWDKFTRYGKISPGDAQCGNVHYAPNSGSDYDWGNTTSVVSYCDDWYSYPGTLPRNARTIDCSEWGCDSRAHLKWWFSHIPHFSGYGPDGKLADWWKYVADYDGAG